MRNKILSQFFIVQVAGPRKWILDCKYMNLGKLLLSVSVKTAFGLNALIQYVKCQSFGIYVKCRYILMFNLKIKHVTMLRLEQFCSCIDELSVYTQMDSLFSIERVEVQQGNKLGLKSQTDPFLLSHCVKSITKVINYARHNQVILVVQIIMYRLL